MEYFFVNVDGNIQYYSIESSLELEILINAMGDGMSSKKGMWSKDTYLAAKKGLVGKAASCGLFGITPLDGKPTKGMDQNHLLCCY